MAIEAVPTTPLKADPDAPIQIDSVEEFLAHAMALETESVDTYVGIAENLRLHNNGEVADLFDKLAEYGRKHVEEVKERSAGMDLPHISPWDFKWSSETSPEQPLLENTHYMMTPYHALRIAHQSEVRAHDFYAKVSAGSNNENVTKAAAEFAEEEATHVALLEEWMKKYPEPEKGWDYDPDPPRMPE